MSAKQDIKKYILNNPISTNKEIAILFNTTADTVSSYRSELKKEGKVDKPKDGWRKKNVPKMYAPIKVKEEDAPDEGIKLKVKELFKKKDVRTIVELSDYLDMGVSKVKKLIEDLSFQGYNFKIENEHVIFSTLIQKAENTQLNIKKMSSGFYKFGALGDNHLCSRYQRLDVLNALYDLYESEGVKVVYNTGNWIDGEARFNKHDLNTFGMDAQIDYFIKHYPQRNGIITYFITGDDHEGWYTQREGVDVGRYAEMKAREAGRTDLVYIGHMEADVELPAKNGKTIVRVLHPGGGSSYAISYTIQKIVESFQGGEKPHVLLAGHYHKADYVFTREVHCVQTGTTQDQSPFMRKKKLAAHLGGWIIEMQTDDNGVVTRFKQEFMPFYDNGYYKKWSYKWK